MRKISFIVCSTIIISFFAPLHAKEMKSERPPAQEIRTEEEAKLHSLFNSLDPLSITQYLAFYELYPQTKQGEKALRKAWLLLNGGKPIEGAENLPFPKFDLQAIISLVTRQSFDPPAELSNDQLTLIEKLGEGLGNRKLKGHLAQKEEEVWSLTPEEIDLARALLLSQFSEAKDPLQGVRQYEASLDLMALQIRARLSSHPNSDEKIREINRFIFQEMQFRFPPHSLYAKDIDLYTFLPSVLDNRQGVCLGVSILYLSLAQRLDLPLEIITPPGHIFLRCEDLEYPLNIETTARGIHLPDDTYLGVNTRKLERRNMREVVGLAFLNQASVFWGKEDYKNTVTLYEKARRYLPDDLLLKTFLGLNYLFVQRTAEGRELLKQVQNFTFDHEVSPDTIADDYLRGKVDADSIKAVFLPVDENRASILEKQKKIQKILSRYPRFRAGLLQLATTWLQLGRGSEAEETLQRYHAIDPSSSTVEYYLALVSLQRMNFLQAWDFLKRTEKITAARSHHPKALKALRNQLKHQCPDPVVEMQKSECKMQN